MGHSSHSNHRHSPLALGAWMPRSGVGPEGACTSRSAVAPEGTSQLLLLAALQCGQEEAAVLTGWPMRTLVVCTLPPSFLPLPLTHAAVQGSAAAQLTSRPAASQWGPTARRWP